MRIAVKPEELIVWSRSQAAVALKDRLETIFSEYDDAAADAFREEVVTRLLLSFGRQDLILLRALTTMEAAARERSGGCGDTLYGLCYMLYAAGEIEDVLLVYAAKHTNFDTGCRIDSDMLTMRRSKQEMVRFVEQAIADDRRLAERLPDLVRDVEEAFDYRAYASSDEFYSFLKHYLGVP